MKKRLHLLLPVIVVASLALAVRITYNLTVAAAYIPLFDAHSYEQIALHLLQEHCFCEHPFVPTVYRAPLWPAIIACIYAVFGQQNLPVRLFLSLVGTGTCLLIFYFIRDLYGKRLGLLAAIFAAFYPELYIYDGWLYSESLTIFLLTALCYLLYRLATRQTTVLSWGLCAVLLALLALARPNGLLACGLFICWLIVALKRHWLSWWSRRQVLLRALLVMGLVLFLLAPWALRNYRVSRSFLPVATGDGTVLLGAYNDRVLTMPGYVGSWINPRLAAPGLARRYPAICSARCELQREEAFKQAAWQWIEGHPSSIPFLLIMHLWNLWQPETVEADLPTIRFPAAPGALAVILMMRILPLLIFALALLGLQAIRKRWHLWLPVLLALASTIGQALIFYGSPRMRAPIEPLLILLASAAIAEWVENWRPRRCWWRTLVGCAS
ncbi:ArnT family glycosyltransferase [Thermogemmatispora sp.]|uniref:ArnT family glycosyltransferase n=1 Tax=Thermogemmatispora sp. TaxID=1968838 RepID=UPI001DE3CA36|nr:glycosyltransferase family 39 protein [Thermogemmatispora sp.]MBX5449960.1 glycosyltransferase family 39 protein [Thermogemmatispora sp.]